MKINVLKAKIRRNNLEEFAGKYFRDETSEIIQKLNNNGKEVLFGIEREDGVFTVIGQNTIYYLSKNGNIGEIPLSVFSNILSKNAINKGKMSNFEYVKNEQNNELIWLNDKSTMESLWNIIIWLEGLNLDENTR